MVLLLLLLVLLSGVVPVYGFAYRDLLTCVLLASQLL